MAVADGLRHGHKKPWRLPQILRIDEHLMGQFEVDVPPENTRATVREMILERADSSIHYRPVSFHEPDETLMLPSSIESLTVFRGSGVPMLRFADVNADVDILEAARDAAQALLQSKPGVVELHLQRWLGGRGEFLKV